MVDKCKVFLSFFSTGLTSIIMNLVLLFLIKFSVDKNEIKNMISSLEDHAFYNFEPSPLKPTDNKIYIKSFFEFKGVYDGWGKIYNTGTITKIYNQYFIHDKDERTYFDYLKYTVAPGESCKENSNQCGIFNSAGRILCLPKEENCPLNGFGISDDPADPKYTTDYEKIEVSDNFENKKYYFYYTNKNINDNIIASFTLSADKPCYNSSQISWPYIFEQSVHYEFCQTFDEETRSVRSKKYFEVSTDILLKTLYNENGIDTTNANEYAETSTVNLYARNFFHKDEKCEKKYLDNISERYIWEIVIKIFYIISIVLTIALLINAVMVCEKCTESFKWFLISTHIYGIILPLIIMLIIDAKGGKLKYNCNEDFGANNKIDNIFNSNFSNINDLALYLGIISSFCLFINMIIFLCLKLCNKSGGGNTKKNTNGTSEIENPNPVPIYGKAQNVIVEQNPINNNKFNNNEYSIPYNDASKADNQMVNQDNKVIANANSFDQTNLMNNNAPAPSVTPLEKKKRKKKKHS